MRGLSRAWRDKDLVVEHAMYTTDIRNCHFQGVDCCGHGAELLFVNYYL